MNEEILILLVEKYKSLYDMSDAFYSNTIVKENCWKDIAIAMKHSIEECKSTWRKLRDCYRKAMNIRICKSGQAAPKKRQWKFEKQMNFIARHMADRQTLTNLENKSNSSESENVSEHTSQEDEARGETDEDNEDNNELSNQENDKNETASQTIRPIPNRPNSKRKNLNQVKTPISDVATVMKEYLNNKSQTNDGKQSNPLFSFFTNMAQTVHTFPKHFQVEVKSKVFSLINEYEMRVAQTLNNTHLKNLEQRTTRTNLSLYETQPENTSDNERNVHTDIYENDNYFHFPHLYRQENTPSCSSIPPSRIVNIKEPNESNNSTLYSL